MADNSSKNKQFPPILFVTGKGGVGKTFVAALLAKKLSLQNKKVLLVEMGSWSYLEETLSLKKYVGFKPVSLPYGFDLARWEGKDCLKDYINYMVKVPMVTEPFMKNAWMQALIHIAPGLREISFLGKLTSGIRNHGPNLPYDHIVVDAVSTGHFLSLIQTPKGLSQVVSTGPLHKQSKSILNVLNTDKYVHTYVVTLLEKYSVTEAFELINDLSNRLDSPISVVANKVFAAPEPGEMSTEEARQFLDVQRKIKEFQAQQLDLFKQENMQINQIPFIFDTLDTVLGDSNAADRLF